METSLNPETDKGWTPEEEQVISSSMLEQTCGRMDAIRRLRSSWRIGETRPPLSRERRKMPKANPRFGQAVEAATENPPEASTQASFMTGEASTPPTTRLEASRLPKAASMRQARWRAKKKESVLQQAA